MTEWVQIIFTFLGVIIGSGLIQFLITRKDDKKNEIKELKEDLKKGLDEREETGKARYTEHQESIEKLNEAIVYDEIAKQPNRKKCALLPKKKKKKIIEDED